MDDGFRTVLLIEDDDEIADLIELHLRDLDLVTERAGDGQAGLDRALKGGFALIILDLMLPRLDGLSVCRSVRSRDSITPILILTARSDEVDRVIGLELGADDYLTKPFGIRELLARVKALLRRAELGHHEHGTHAAGPGDSPIEADGGEGAGNGTSGAVRIGELVLDEGKRKVNLHGKEVDLTAKEFDLLALFMKNPGRAFSRNDLLNLVWEYQFEGYEHTVNTHINRLRNKIEDDSSHPVFLKTLWGVGYRFAEPDEFQS